MLESSRAGLGSRRKNRTRLREVGHHLGLSTVKGIVDRFCGGSLERVLRALVDAGLTDSQQLAIIADKVKRRPR